MTTNVFYRVPNQRGSKVAAITGHDCTLDQFCNYVLANEGLSKKDFIMAFGTQVLRPSSCRLQSINVQNNSHIDIIIPALGGKGGFGSLLRAIGAQIEKTTNRDACRDLSGRRLRDIKREDELKKLLALQEKLEEERKRRRKEKLENLKRKVDNSSSETSIQELVAMFDDHEYNTRRRQLSDILDAAVEKGIINFKKRQLEEGEAVEKYQNKKSRKDSQSESGTGNETSVRCKNSSSPNSSRKSEGEGSSEDDEPDSKGEINKRKNLWLGLEDDL